MPAKILVADFSIWTMDNKLGFLIAGNAILIASVCVWVLAVAREFLSPFTCHPAVCKVSGLYTDRRSRQ